ncbi:uncharacterized protein TNCV_4058401 [Trichonephila clavipes]|nr:uncharacterized protein TNCV_4058401 [Trichonephila clavipes]
MEDTTLKHSPKYQALEMFSHIGGYVGIWLGISLLALCEFIEGAIRVISFILSQRKKKKEHSKSKMATSGQSTQHTKKKQSLTNQNIKH